MQKFIIIVGIIWVVASAAVPMLQGIELPQGGLTNSNQAAQLELAE